MNELLLSDTFDHFLLSEAVITTFVTFRIDGDLHGEYYEEEKANHSQLYDTKANGVIAAGGGSTASGVSAIDSGAADSPVVQKKASWKELKPFCLSIIKGKKPPLSFKIVLELPRDEVALLIARSGMNIKETDVFGLFLNCQFQSGIITLISGSSLRIFTLDKSLDQAFDMMLRDFLTHQEIEYEA